MSKHLQAIRGMNDILPSDIHLWQYVENELKRVLDSFSYQEIRIPIIEKTELFSRSIGEQTDIVEKEMYTFDDRNNDSLTLRPEGTAGCIRAGIEHSLFYNQVQRLWYSGPMYRYERPQKGRYRQFYQLGVEAIGMPGPDIDAEIILLSAKFWELLGISNNLTLQINTLGLNEERTEYKKQLVQYFQSHYERLDAESQKRLETNPLRILDSKNEAMADLLASAPNLYDSLSEESQNHFKDLLHILDTVGIKYEINHHLVRGLDYYTHTVFEWVTDKLGAQNAVCAGGRYDGLVKQLGGQLTPAIGFAMGYERLIELVKATNNMDTNIYPHAYLMAVGEKAIEQSFLMAKKIRSELTDFRLVHHCGGGSFKSQFKKADKSGAAIALILGDDEVENSEIAIKFLREDKPQKTIKQDELIDFLR